MEFDFDTPVCRRGTNSYKWDSEADGDVIPLWVADMDFRTAPVITEALRRRVDQGIFGYTRVPDAYYNATVEWFARRHQLEVDRNHILYTSGVVPAVSAAIKALTEPGDKVIVQTPVYNCFFSSIRNNGCEVLENPLVYADGTYSVDFEDLRRKANDPKAKILLMCNPHNPAGRVWTRDELEMMGRIAIDNGLTVVSDEIHCELVYEPYRYIPFASISEEFYAKSVTCTSPSKAFNTAGLQIANIFVADAHMRRAIDRAININEVCDVNPFGVEALIAAYTSGEEWLSALKDYLYENYLTLCKYFNEHCPRLSVVTLEGTYLAWVDCRALGLSSEELERILLKEAKVWINGGTHYGAAGEGFIRINLACPRQLLMTALERMVAVLQRL